jgi:hypothetical protein
MAGWQDGRITGWQQDGGWLVWMVGLLVDGRWWLGNRSLLARRCWHVAVGTAAVGMAVLVVALVAWWLIDGSCALCLWCCCVWWCISGAAGVGSFF